VRACRAPKDRGLRYHIGPAASAVSAAALWLAAERRHALDAAIGRGSWTLAPLPGSGLKCSCSSGSEAVAAGLCAGQCILKVNGTSVANDGALEVLEHFQAFRNHREEALVSTERKVGGCLPSWRPLRLLRSTELS
jgi:hypothetical protein